MAVYEYKGNHYELSDDLSVEQAKAKIQAHLGETAEAAKPTTTATAAPEQPKKNEVSSLYGNPLFRIVKGAVIDPVLGTGQLMNNTGYNGLLLNPLNAISQTLQQSGMFGKTVQQNANINDNIKQLDRNVADSRAAQGSTGFDWWQLGGSVISPLNKVAAAVNPVTKPTSVITRLGNAAGTGAVLSSAQPVVSDNYALDKGIQVSLGAVLGSVVEGGVNAVGKLGDIFRTFTASGRTQVLKDYIDKLAGNDKQAVIKALQDAQELVTGSRPTAAEAIANIPSAAEIAVAQSKLSTKQGLVGKFAERSAEQQAARARTLQQISGTEAERVALSAERQAVTSPMREGALNQVDEAGKVLTKLEKEIADGYSSLESAIMTVGNTKGAVLRNKPINESGIGSIRSKDGRGWLTAGDIVDDATKRGAAYEGKAETIRQNIRLKEYQRNSLEQNGFFPLKAQDLVDDIDRILSGTIADESRAILKGVKEDILKRADENGIVNSRDIYENVRKVSNQKIAQYLGIADSQFANGGLPQQAAKAASNVKKVIDAAFNRSSDGLWGKYLSKFQEYSNKLNRMEVGDYLASKLNTSLDKERAGVFATAVDNAARTIKNATGNPRYDKLSQVLTENETKTVNSVLADLNRLAKSQELAKKGREMTDIQPNLSGEVPSLISRPIAVMRSILQHIQRGNSAAFNERLADLMLDPAAMAKFMSESVPKNKVSELTTAMMKMMNYPTRVAFVQSFTVPEVSKELGGGGTPTLPEVTVTP